MMSVHLKWKRQRIKAGREVQFIPLWPADPARPSPMSGFIGYGIDNALFKAFINFFFTTLRCNIYTGRFCIKIQGVARKTSNQYYSTAVAVYIEMDIYPVHG
ncbi:hypothetical protein AFLA_006155 [Aspergillus flavus NRRL3357]|nr:hypothetical protein AFLA_006155 [Aspergillus flavus NRRL3357]